MKLYHAPISTCSQKVRLVLAEKGVEYDSEFVDLQKGKQFAPEYLAKNPAGVVPTLEDAGRVLVESTLINEYLEETCAGPALAPQAPVERHAMRLWCKKVDELHPSCGIQTYAIGIRPGMLKRAPEEVAALIDAIPDPGRRAIRRSVVEHGVEAPEFGGAYEAHIRLFDLADQALSGNPFLVGDALTLADTALLPYVLRVDHLCLQGLLDGRAGLAAWYERMQARPSFQIAVADYLPEPVVAAFKTAGSAVADTVARVVARR